MYGIDKLKKAGIKVIKGKVRRSDIPKIAKIVANRNEEEQKLCDRIKNSSEEELVKFMKMGIPSEWTYYGSMGESDPVDAVWMKMDGDDIRILTTTVYGDERQEYFLAQETYIDADIIKDICESVVPFNDSTGGGQYDTDKDKDFAQMLNNIAFGLPFHGGYSETVLNPKIDSGQDLEEEWERLCDMYDLPCKKAESKTYASEDNRHIIMDWAGNEKFDTEVFESFEQADEFLNEQIDNMLAKEISDYKGSEDKYEKDFYELKDEFQIVKLEDANLLVHPDELAEGDLEAKGEDILSDRFEQLEILERYMDSQGVMDSLVRAMSDYDFEKVYEGIAQDHDFEMLEESYEAGKRHDQSDHLIEMLGLDEALHAIVKAMSDQDFDDNFQYITRMHEIPTEANAEFDEHDNRGRWAQEKLEELGVEEDLKEDVRKALFSMWNSARNDSYTIMYPKKIEKYVNDLIKIEDELPSGGNVTFVAISETEDEEEMLEIDYKCYKCGHEWQEEYTSACDSECDECGARNVTALDYRVIEGEAEMDKYSSILEKHGCDEDDIVNYVNNWASDEYFNDTAYFLNNGYLLASIDTIMEAINSEQCVENAKHIERCIEELNSELAKETQEEVNEAVEKACIVSCEDCNFTQFMSKTNYNLYDKELEEKCWMCDGHNLEIECPDKNKDKEEANYTEVKNDEMPIFNPDVPHLEGDYKALRDLNRNYATVLVNLENRSDEFIFNSIEARGDKVDMKAKSTDKGVEIYGRASDILRMMNSFAKLGVLGNFERITNQADAGKDLKMVVDQMGDSLMFVFKNFKKEKSNPKLQHHIVDTINNVVYLNGRSLSKEELLEAVNDMKSKSDDAFAIYLPNNAMERSDTIRKSIEELDNMPKVKNIFKET